MTRASLSFRVSQPSATNNGDDRAARAVYNVVQPLFHYFSSADADGWWYFQHVAPPGRDLEVWFHSTPAVIAELERRLLGQVAKHDRLVTLHLGRPDPPGGQEAQPPGLAERLATASSSFALELLGGGDLDAAAQLDVTALHLHFLTEALPAAERPAFLFFCWHHWTRRLAPQRRIELAEQAEKHAPDLLRRVPEPALPPEWEPAWQRYVGALKALLQSRPADDGTPLNYLLFRHAHLTHNRLGIPVATEAMAARALRIALVSGVAASA